MTLEEKIGISSFFNTNWTETEIHYANLEFDIGLLDEWIRVEYRPTSSTPFDIEFSSYANTGIIEIDIYARKENRCYQIYDLLLDLLRLKKFDSLKVRSIDISGKDIFQTTNGDYINLDLSISVKSL